MLDVRSPARELSSPLRRAAGRLGGVKGNERLTGTTAVVLLVLLAAEGATLLSMRSLLSVHVFIGMLLVPPIALKLASTGYRFVRYYTGSRAYKVHGPPPWPLRLIAPAVVASTVGLFASGVALVVLGPGTRFVLPLHKASFVVWFGSTAIHVLGHLLRVSRLAAADLRRHDRVPGSRLRTGVVATSLVVGTTLAIATLPLAEPWLRHGFGFDR